jgi:hypothetical protein
MVSKLGLLPPSASALHGHACKRSPEFGQVIMMDLRGKGEARIEAQFAGPSATEPSHRFLVPCELNDDTGSKRTCPHVKSARRFGRLVNPLSATER